MTSVLEPVVETTAASRIFHLRDVEWRDSGNGKEYTFVGNAAVFNSWSEVLWTPRGSFRERFLPGSFSSVLAENPDVRFLINHDKNLVLARSKSGTLELKEENGGLRVWSRVARTTYATDLKLAMDRGDIDQMSVRFEMDYNLGAEDRWYENKQTGEVLRDIVRASGLIDVSVVTFPAYEKTTAELRELQLEIERAESRGRIPAEVRSFFFPQQQSAVLDDIRPREYARCKQVVGETPWAILPSHLAVIMAILDERSSGYRPSQEEIRERVGVQRDNSPAAVGAVSVIPVVGLLSGAMQQVSGAKSLDDFRAEFRAAVSDPEVSAIVLDFDSPGGTVDLVPETAAEIRAATKVKPVVGVANAMAASAAYWLLTACSEAVCTPSGEVGSVGVYSAHQDMSEMMRQKGVKTTFISAGKYKTTGNMFEPLSDEAKAKIQDDVDAVYEDFVGAVAKNRGVSVQDVIDNYGEGWTLQARAALKAGMVDSVETIDQVVSRLQATVEARDLMLTPDEAREAEGMQKFAAAIPPHNTAIVDKPWDGPAATAKVKAERGPLRALHAWVETGGNPDLKGSYKFPHHEVGDNGIPGPANVNGVRNALSRLPGSSIPDADKPGVERHLQRHLSDFHEETAEPAGPEEADPQNASLLSLSTANSTASNVDNSYYHQFDTRESLKSALGIVAQVGPVGERDAAPETAGTNRLAALRAETSDAVQREKEEFLRLLGRMSK
jgi:capsid assembly protease